LAKKGPLKAQRETRLQALKEKRAETPRGKRGTDGFARKKHGLWDATDVSRPGKNVCNIGQKRRHATHRSEVPFGGALSELEGERGNEVRPS